MQTDRVFLSRFNSRHAQVAALPFPLLSLLPTPDGYSNSFRSQGADDQSRLASAPYFFGDVVETHLPLAGGSAGTFQSLTAMADCCVIGLFPEWSGCYDPRVRAIAEQITEGSKSEREQVQKLFYFVRDNIVYVIHEENEQRVQDCLRSLQFGSGDCVSASVCLATLLKSLGFAPYFVAQHVSDKAGFNHVYVCLKLDGEELCMDPIAKDKPIGWRQSLPDGAFEFEQEIT